MRFLEIDFWIYFGVVGSGWRDFFWVFVGERFFFGYGFRDGGKALARIWVSAAGTVGWPVFGRVILLLTRR